MKTLSILRAGCISLLLMGCGRAPVYPASPSAPESSGQAAQGVSRPESTAEFEPPAEQSRAPSEPSSLPVAPSTKRNYALPPDSYDGGHEGVRSLWEELSAAEQVALSVRSGCERACRALLSMHRATERLCELASDEPEKKACQQARQRLREAKETVRRSCQRCEQGPSLTSDD